MKKIFTLIALLGMFVSGAWAQVVTWSVSNKVTYSAGTELSSNTDVVSVKLGETALSWLYNSGRGGITTYVQGTPANGGSYIVVKPVKDITFSLATYSSMSNCNLKMYEENAPSTVLKDFRQKAAVTNDFGTLAAGKTYYIYGEGFKTTAAAGNTSSLEYIFYKSFTATSVETYTINYKDTEGNALKDPRNDTGLYGTNVTATSEDMENIVADAGTYVYASGNTEISLGTTNVINLVFEKSAVASTNYTINYKLSDGTVIADPVQHSGLVGDADVVAANNEVLTYIIKEGVKYKYVSGNNAITLVEDENSNVITLLYAEAAKYTGKVIATDKDGNELGEIATLPAVYEGDSFTYGFPQYYLNGTTLYNVANNGSGDWYRNTVSPNEDNYEVKIKYSGASVSNVVYYTEAESIPAVSVANYTNRASNGQVAHTGGAENYKDVTTIAPGKYKIYVKGLNGNSAARACNFKVGENVVFTFSITQGTNQTGNSDEFTVTTESTLSFASEGSSTSGLDWLYLVKTGDYTINATLNASGLSTFSAACPMQITGATVYKAALVDGVLKCTEVEGGLVPAGEGVILEGEANATATATYVASAPAIEGNDLKATTLADGSLATIESCVVLSGDKFLGYNGNAFVANKAYLPWAQANAAVRLSFNESTGISNVINVNTVAPAKRLVNGQIVIEKNGVKYNAAGAQMK